MTIRVKYDLVEWLRQLFSGTCNQMPILGHNQLKCKFGNDQKDGKSSIAFGKLIDPI